MGQKLSEQDRELYRRVDEVLHYLWDPIGVSHEPYARDEYDSYMWQVFALVKSSTEVKEIAGHLTKIEQDQMGLRPAESKARQVAEILLARRKKIFEQ